jgi:hypothetical protein
MRSNSCRNCSTGKTTRPIMDSALTLIAALAFWWVLQVWLLPRCGVPT